MYTYGEVLIVYHINIIAPDFYTAWDVIAKHVLDYSLDPMLAQR